jgi:hypothetical protein
MDPTSGYCGSWGTSRDNSCPLVSVKWFLRVLTVASIPVGIEGSVACFLPFARLVFLRHLRCCCRYLLCVVCFLQFFSRTRTLSLTTQTCKTPSSDPPPLRVSGSPGGISECVRSHSLPTFSFLELVVLIGVNVMGVSIMLLCIYGLFWKVYLYRIISGSLLGAGYLRKHAVFFTGVRCRCRRRQFGQLYHICYIE